MTKILLLSTWGSQCGIATYTEQLVEAALAASPAVDITVGRPPPAADERSAALPAVEAVPLWSRELEDGGLLLSEHIRQREYDVLHIQHEDGLFRHRPQFLSLLREVPKTVAVYITLHTVQRGHGAFYRKLAGRAMLVVHTVDAALYLAACGIPNFVVIPHGTPKVLPLRRAEARAKLEERYCVPRDGQLALTLGFMGPNKNIVNSMFGFAEARSEDKRYLVAGRCHPSYDKPVQWTAQQVFDDALHIHPAFVDDADVPLFMGAADFCILNSNAATMSASGQVHLCAAYEKPLLAARKPIYSDALRAGALMFGVGDAHTPSREFVDHLDALYSSPALRAAVGRNLAEYGRATLWERVYKTYYKTLWEVA